ncbi:uncharacterized protein LOC143459347 isoform X2 [Clavelina lepadiformis]|uniref:uncharacterized protein LOC143459347 isoform X2 n=1 Tax=Clavelina lepadiformis TaxID=159417 RepID=UPI0040415909
MKRKKNSPKKSRKSRKTKKEHEKFFVSNFLKQPGKTRSGVRYSKKRKGKSSSECIFGSLVTSLPSSTQSLNNVSNSNALQTAKDQCSCKQCAEQRRKEELRTCTSSQSGLSFLLKSEEQQNNSVISPSSSTNGSTATNSSNCAESVQKKASNERIKQVFCDCKECCGVNRKSSSSQANIAKVRSRHRLLKHSRHPLEQSMPKQKTKKARKMKQTAHTDKRKPIKKRAKARAGKSLLKYVLKKTPTITNLSLPTTSAGQAQSDNCICCQKCLENLKNYIKEQIFKQASCKSQGKKKSHEELSHYFRVCKHKKCKSTGEVSETGEKDKDSSSTPRVSAGPNTSEASKTRAVGYKKEGILFPSAGQVQNKIKNSSHNPVGHRSSRKASIKRKAKSVKKKQLRKQHQLMSKKLGKRSTKASSVGSVLRKTKSTKSSNKKTSRKWKLLSKATIKKIKIKQLKRLAKQQTKKKGKDIMKKQAQSTVQVAPMPSAMAKCKETKLAIEEIEENGHDSCGRQESKKMTQKISKLIRQLATDTDQPVPSGKSPTFIAMVKTAIRDLKPFNLTGKDAISKYIQLRYHVKNASLLSYVLKWMVEMGLLKQRNGQYRFSGKRLVKKQTVAVLGSLKRKALKAKLHRKNLKKVNDHFKAKLSRKKKLNSKKRRKNKKSKTRKSKCRKVLKRNKCKNEKCTCAKELKALKNRIKVKTRYIRKNGKIYKQEEYI